MYSVLLCTTIDSDLPAPLLGPGVDWVFLRELLRREISEQAAMLFAEPVRDPTRGLTHWHVETNADPKPLAALGPADLADCVAKLELRRKEILDFADAREIAGGEAGRSIAEMLRLVISVPDEAAYVWSVSTDPVLCAWGRGVARRDTRGSSIVARAGPPAPVEPAPHVIQPSGGRPVSPPPLPLHGKITEIAAVTVATPHRRWALPVVIGLWALFAVLCVSILLALIPACAINVSILPGLFDRCLASQSPENASRLHNAELRARLRAAELAIATRRSDCLAANPPTAPVPPAGPTLAETEQRRRQSNAAVGKLDITLAWNGREDLDLHIYCPTGHIYYSGRKVCGGELQIDRNKDDASTVDDPIEHVTWSDPPPSGNYRVVVVMYSRRDQPPRNVPFTIVVSDETGEHTYPGVVDDISKEVQAASFVR